MGEIGDENGRPGHNGVHATQCKGGKHQCRLQGKGANTNYLEDGRMDQRIDIQQILLQTFDTRGVRRGGSGRQEKLTVSGQWTK